MGASSREKVYWHELASIGTRTDAPQKGHRLKACATGGGRGAAAARMEEDRNDETRNGDLRVPSGRLSLRLRGGAEPTF